MPMEILMPQEKKREDFFKKLTNEQLEIIKTGMLNDIIDMKMFTDMIVDELKRRNKNG